MKWFVRGGKERGGSEQPPTHKTGIWSPDVARDLRNSTPDTIRIPGNNQEVLERRLQLALKALEYQARIDSGPLRLNEAESYKTRIDMLTRLATKGSVTIEEFERGPLLKRPSRDSSLSRYRYYMEDNEFYEDWKTIKLYAELGGMGFDSGTGLPQIEYPTS